jgi:hypothetical protein
MSSKPILNAVSFKGVNMKSMQRIYWVASLLSLVGLAGTARADMTSSISQLTTEAAKRYISPIVSGFGADLNAGWYHKAPPADKFNFTLEGGTIVMGTFLSGGDKTFDVQGAFRFDTSMSQQLISNVDMSGIPAGQQQAVRDSLALRLATHDNTVRFYGPTIIGAQHDSVRIVFSGRNLATGLPTPNDSVLFPTDTLALPVGGVLEAFKKYPLPLLAPQIAIGTVYGTNLTLRWLPTMSIPDIGSFKFFGFGIQHNPQVWIGSPLPLDLCLGYFHQNLQVGSLFEAQTNAFGVDMSKTFGWRLLNATPYAGFQFETANMTFHYDLNVDTPTGKQVEKIQFDLQGDNSTRLTLGLSLHLLILNLNADYNFAKYPSVSVGLMFGV